MSRALQRRTASRRRCYGSRAGALTPFMLTPARGRVSTRAGRRRLWRRRVLVVVLRRGRVLARPPQKLELKLVHDSFQIFCHAGPQYLYSQGGHASALVCPANLGCGADGLFLSVRVLEDELGLVDK